MGFSRVAFHASPLLKTSVTRNMSRLCRLLAPPILTLAIMPTVSVEKNAAARHSFCQRVSAQRPLMISQSSRTTSGPAASTNPQTMPGAKVAFGHSRSQSRGCALTWLETTSAEKVCTICLPSMKTR